MPADRTDEEIAREIAINLVDRARGYTAELSSDPGYHRGLYVELALPIFRALRAARAAEREACAKEARHYGCDDPTCTKCVGGAIEAAIRARAAPREGKG